MNERDEFLKAVINHRIVEVELETRGSLMGEPVAEDDIIVKTIRLDNNRKIHLYGSPRIDENHVYAGLEE